MKDWTIWQIDDSIIEWIKFNIDKGSDILELGSGSSSRLISEAGYNVVSVEHDEKWLFKFPEINYIYAPIKPIKPVQHFDHTKWYDKEAISKIGKTYSLIIVDGPPADIGRSGFLKYLDLFDTSVPILFDDVNRNLELKLAIKVSGRLKRPLTIYNTWNEDKHWGVV